MPSSVLDDPVTFKIVRLKDDDNLTWDQISAAIPEMEKEGIRARYRRFKAKHTPPSIAIEGVTPDDESVDPQEALSRAINRFTRTDRLVSAKRQQFISFSHGPVAITHFADHHFGDEGVNYRRAFEEAELVTSTPGMYIGLVGDLVNNFILGRFLHLYLNNAITKDEESAIFKLYLELIGPQLLYAVAGNHDYWTEVVAGIPYFREALGDSHVLYDRDQVDVTVRVGSSSYPGRIRHRWRGKSQYNPSHGIEWTYKFADKNFIWGVSAHYHEGGLVREFNADGQVGLALVCGSYKEHDEYARQLGLPNPCPTTAVTLILDENGIRGESNLTRAVDFMSSHYSHSPPPSPVDD